MFKRKRIAKIGKQSIPYGLIHVKYLESTGSQFIDTGVVLNGNNFNFQIDYSMPDGSNSGGNLLCGSNFTWSTHVGSEGNNFLLMPLKDKGTISGTFTSPHYIDEKYHYEFSPETVIKNDKTLDFYESFTESSINDDLNTDNTSIKLCSLGNEDQKDNNFIGRIYCAQMEIDGERVLNLTPIIDKKGKPALYDKVTRKTHENLGTEFFRTDNIEKGFLPLGYTKLEYLESDAKQKISITGIDLGTSADILESVALVPQELSQTYRYPYYMNCDLSGEYSDIYSTLSYVIYITSHGQGYSNIMLQQEVRDINNSYMRPSDWTTSANVYGSGTVDNDTKFLLTMKNRELFINGKSCGKVDAKYQHPDLKIKSMGFFYWWANTKFRIYNAKRISLDTGKILCSLICCLDNTGTPCMYDLVSNKTFYNSGTGEFIYPKKIERPTGLPHKYTPLEYLKSTGSQMIDTLHYANNNTKYTCKYQIESFPQVGNIIGTDYSSVMFIVENRDENNANGNCSLTAYSQKQFYMKWGSSTFHKSHTLQPQYITEIIMDNTGVTATTISDKKTVTIPITYSEITSKNTTTIFRPRPYLSDEYGLKIYNFKTIDGGKPKNNFVPALDETGTPCMYDLVTYKTFYNSGTGEFEYDSPVEEDNEPSLLPNDYTKLDYLESTGVQYIDTGIKLTNKSKVKCNFTYLTSQNTILFGARKKQKMGPAFAGVGYNTSFQYGMEQTGESYQSFSTGVNTTRGLIIADGKSWVLDYGTGKSSYEFNDTEFETTQTCYLFACHNDNGVEALMKGRIREFSIESEGVLQLNFIPALDPDGNPCMYDTVSQKPFYNMGTGQDFLYYIVPSTLSLRKSSPEYALLTDTGVRRLYHVPKNYLWSLEDYANEYGYKRLIETECPNEDGKCYAVRWIETDTEITNEWYEVSPKTETIEEIHSNDIENDLQPTTLSLRKPSQVEEESIQYALLTDTGVRRLYHVPKNYTKSFEDYVNDYGYKRLIETECPNEDGKFYEIKWIETDTEIRNEWYEIIPPIENKS